MNLNNYFFDVEEQDISLIPNVGANLKPINDFKAIVVTIGGAEKVVSVAKNSYRLIRNKDLIDPFMENLEKLNVDWVIDPSHSFCLAHRMRLQVTFPGVLVHDGQSEIPLSVYLHNSYDQSEGVRLFWGAIRSICSNGMIFGSVLGSLYARHTSGFSFDKLEDQFKSITDKIMDVQTRIDQLKDRRLEEHFMKELQKALGKKRLKAIVSTDRIPDKSQWELLNDITYYISHEVEKPRRADLQLKTSKVFAL
ncbi:MAG: DUF932 domain-containing protein [Balneolaceae bacterium]